MAFEIRAGRPEDYDQVCELFRQLDALHVELLPANFRPFDGPARSVESYGDKISSPNKAFFVAVEAQRIIGFADVQKTATSDFPLFHPRTFAFIDNIYVVPELRGSGVAQALFTQVKSWAKAQNISAVQLKVYNVNAGAMKFYQKEGMSAVSTTFELKL